MVSVFSLLDALGRCKGDAAALPQNGLTLRMPVKRAQEAQLRRRLAEIDADPPGNGLMPFAALADCVHFIRFVLLPGPDHAQQYATTLVLMADVDGPVPDFLQRLVDDFPDALDALFGCCSGYPPPSARNRRSRLRVLGSHRLHAQTYYVNTLGRSVLQVLAEDRLYIALQAQLDVLAPAPGGSASALREALLAHVRTTPSLAWALQPAAAPPAWYQLREQLRFAALAAGGGVVVLWTWPLLLAWLWQLQRMEERDVPATLRPDLPHVSRLRAVEDHQVNNAFFACGPVKPGCMRLLTARAVLAVAQVATRHWFNDGDLAGIPLLNLHGVDTIHFARWVFIDDDRRVLFASVYDGSLESYMVDFIDKVAWGLNIVFSNGTGYPYTRFLVLQGARNEEAFKAHLAIHQLPAAAAWSPYGHLTAVNLARNARVRAGLQGRMSEAEAARWLEAF